MDKIVKTKLQNIMTALQKVQENINELKDERDKLYKEFKDTLPPQDIMRIVK